ncbi:MAG: hypothetical protein AB8C95_03655 [Phycisphaeraceae bacterium]
MRRFSVLYVSIVWLLIAVAFPGLAEEKGSGFDKEKDLLSLHYDHAKDRDDGHSAAADRSILETMFGKKWIKEHVMAISGVHGKNGPTFVKESDKVMDAVWNDSIGWLTAHERHEEAAQVMLKRWLKTLKAGGDIWIKEGGQSDLTADVVKLIKKVAPDIDTTKRIHVVQHSEWNEKKTTDEDLAYTKNETHYIRINDANRYLSVRKGDKAFEQAALQHPVFGPSWKAAFEYFTPRKRLDFSDTGELMHILDLGEMSIDTFREKFLEKRE